MASVSWQNGSSGNWTTAAGWTSQAVPGPIDDVTIDTPGSYTVTLEAVADIDSLAIGAGGASLALTGAGAALDVTYDVANTGTLSVDGGATGDGGSTVTIGGTLSNTGTMAIGPGNNSLDASATITAGALINTGAVLLRGGTGATAQNRAELSVLDVAPASLTGTFDLDGAALLQFVVGGITAIAAGAQLTEQGASADVALITAPTTNSALATLAAVAGELDLDGGASIAVAGNLAVSGALRVDDQSGGGGSRLTVAGTLTNSGSLLLGPGDFSLTGGDTIAATGLVNAGGITLTGGRGASPSLALLNVAAVAPSLLTGAYDLQGDALLEFASGAVGGIASGASLRESGAAAVVALASGTTTNSALYALATIAGTLDLEAGASVGISGNLGITGTLELDTAAGTDGAALRMDGTLNNSGLITVGPASLTLGANDTIAAGGLLNTGVIDLFGGHGASPSQARLGVSTTAPAALTGSFDLEGDALLQFTNGAITSIAAGASLREGDSTAVAAINGSLTTNSALVLLADIAGELDLDDGASVTTQTSLTVGGTLRLDDRGVGGAAVAIAGTLFNSGTIGIGPTSSALTVADSITAAGLSNTGVITLNGGGGGGQPQASLTIASAAPATLSGSTSLFGNALLQYASGAITSIGAGAYLAISGDTARVAVASGAATNSALGALATIAGELDLDSGGSLQVAGNLTVSGKLLLDSFDGAALSVIGVAGTLTNTGGIFVGPNTGAQSGAATAAALVNTGQLVLRGAGTTEALLTILGAAPSILTGSDVLFANSAVQFASGGITGIAAGAFVGEDAATARIALAGAPGTNSALAGLASVAGTFDVDNGVALTTDTGLTVAASGAIAVDTAPSAGGSAVTLGGTLVNMGLIAVGAADSSLGSSATIAAAGLVNGGTVGLVGGATATALVDLSGPASNAGVVVIGDGAALDLSGSGPYTQTAGTTTIAGTLTGALALAGGVVAGDGTITGALDEAGGTLIAGLSALAPGALAVTGSYTIASAGVLQIALGGTAPAAFSALNVSGGAASLGGGTLDVATVDGFAPSAGESFPILTCAPGQLSGTFATFDLNGTLASAGGSIDLPNHLRIETVYDDAQGSVTLAVVSTAQPAQAAVTPATIDLGSAHVGANPTAPVDVANTAPAQAAYLDASVGAVGGAASASGVASLIAPGQSRSGAITVGIAAASDGARSGTVTIDLTSDPHNGGAPLALPSQVVSIGGAFYNEAAASVRAPAGLVVHVGDVGTITLSAVNGAPADGFSENLIASLAGISGGFAASGASPGEIGAGASGTLSATYTARQAGVIAGTATIDVASDGGTGANGIDGLGVSALAPVVVPVAVTVDNAALPAFEAVGGPGAITGGGGAFTLDLGTIAQGAAPLAVELGILNAASGPADLLSGAITAAGDIAISGLAPFSGLAAGQADVAPAITLDSAAPGAFSETITLAPTGSNASGYAQALPAERLTVLGDVSAAASSLSGAGGGTGAGSGAGGGSGTGSGAGGGSGTDSGAGGGSGTDSGTGGGSGTGGDTVPGTVSVLGAGGVAQWVAFGSAGVAALATQLLGLIDETKTLFIDAAGATTLAAGQIAAVVAATGNVSLTGNGADGEVIAAGAGALNFTAGPGGSGSLVAGAGNDLIYDPAVGGNWSMVLGSGIDTVVAAGGNDTVATGTGGTLVFLGTGASSVASSGADTVIGGTGGATVAAATSDALVFALGGPLAFIGGTGASTVVAGAVPATLFGGASGGSLVFGDGATQFTGGGATDTVVGLAGSMTVAGGAGGGLYFGGAAGGNQITAGSGDVTAFGGGAGDVLTATGSAADLFAGGVGAETLSGAGSSGTNTFFAGFGPETLIGGAGQTALVAGAGADLLTGGGGLTLFLFVDGRTAGASDTIGGWDPTHDFVKLAGYGGSESSTVMNATVANGAATIALSDGTRVTFAGVTQLNPASFT